MMDLMLYVTDGIEGADGAIDCNVHVCAISEDAYEELAHAKILNMLPKKNFAAMMIDGEELVKDVEVYKLKDDILGLNPFFMNSMDLLTFMLEDGVSLCNKDKDICTRISDEIGEVAETITKYGIDYISLD